MLHFTAEKYDTKEIVVERRSYVRSRKPKVKDTSTKKISKYFNIFWNDSSVKAPLDTSEYGPQEGTGCAKDEYVNFQAECVICKYGELCNK